MVLLTARRSSRGNIGTINIRLLNEACALTLALKTRNSLSVESDDALSALPNWITLTQGVALGNCISRLWR